MKAQRWRAAAGWCAVALAGSSAIAVPSALATQSNAPGSAVDPGMRKGVCSIPHGHLDANVSHLTGTDDVDPLGGMALYSGVPIEIEALG